MRRVMKIEGMSCGHCVARVEKLLNALPGVSAQVDLETGSATIDCPDDADMKALKQAVEDAGYQVVSVD
ncbi:MAG: heavy metal-associated domain-containing protein [Christensenella sp.]|nr:heavy metal-associated domain-containing protein [Christensenella sp.]